MLRRKAYKRFEFWKAHKTKQALLVTGARQVGKTYLIRQFIQASYDSSVEFNLVDDSATQASFTAATDADDLMLRISIASTTLLVPHETAIFLDEIQECPNVMRHIKLLVDKGEYDFILSGSLLGVTLENVRSLPTGYVTEIEMFPLDFEEFCWANNLSDQAWPIVREAFEKRSEVPDFLHERMLRLFHLYLLVGGMPDAVNAFLETGTIDQVRVAQQNIISYYKMDITKYAPKGERLIIRNIFDLIPSELNGTSKRFKFSSIENVKRFNQVTDEFLWLVNAGVAIATYKAFEPKRPLLVSKQENKFKLFFSDVGLLTSTFLKQVTANLLDGKTGMNMGGTYENAIAQELNSHGFDSYYFRTRRIGELDFVIEHTDGSIDIFEVKSGSDYKTHQALKNALECENYDIAHAYVLAESNVIVAGEVTYLPVYMVALFNLDER